MPDNSLQQRTMLCGGGFQHFASATMPLSIKSFTGGSAHYRTSKGSYTVHENTWLVLNDQEPYTIEFDSKTFVRSTVVFFPTGWAETVARSLTDTQNNLLDDPAPNARSLEFHQTISPDDGKILPQLAALDRACRGKQVPDDWLEEKLYALLESLLHTHSEHRKRTAQLPASKRNTREELYRRLCRGRDFLHAHAFEAPTLDQAARAAALSPYHFHRSFHNAFGQTPRQYTETLRLQRAESLLPHAPTTDVALAVGYESYSAFHDAYRRHFGKSPRQTAKT